MIGTSIYISKDRYARLKKTAVKLGWSESEILSVLLKKSRALFGKNAITGRAVKYQRGGDPAEFVIRHIDLTESDYEFATGRRYLFKVSVSFLFAVAISVFLEIIEYEWTHQKDSASKDWQRYKTSMYYQHYEIKHLEEISAEFWTIPWPRE